MISQPLAASTPDDTSDFYFFPKSEALHIDEKLMEATDIAVLNAHKHSQNRCWRSVKNALLEAGVIPYRPTSKYAWQAGEELEQKFGFSKLEISDPFEAPISSILVYGGPGAGHVEFRTADGFVSDFTNPRPSRRPLIGVYIRSSATKTF
ncbi:MAG: hypothetical protein JNK65_07285 [Deltaproteobacteria bacterium]|nr:hypothetical protein [Deltaproteobacteria bacterium]